MPLFCRNVLGKLKEEQPDQMQDYIKILPLSCHILFTSLRQGNVDAAFWMSSAFSDAG
jgi:hypothetical protein